MTRLMLISTLINTSLFAVTGAAIAQETAGQAVVESDGDAATSSEATNDTDASEHAEPNTDNVADLLNSQQQLQQTFTLRRTINGAVVETDRRTVTYDRTAPSRETEAGGSTLDRLMSTFDGEVLTRTEAFEESKLDFTIADANRDGAMSVEEFSALVASWQETGARTVGAPNAEIARQRQYDAFLAEISPETAKTQSETFAKEKFMFLTGGAQSVSRKDYIREYLLDFDAMDANKDTILKGNELHNFRALNRGEKIDT